MFRTHSLLGSAAIGLVLAFASPGMAQHGHSHGGGHASVHSGGSHVSASHSFAPAHIQANGNHFGTVAPGHVGNNAFLSHGNAWHGGQGFGNGWNGRGWGWNNGYGGYGNGNFFGVGLFFNSGFFGWPGSMMWYPYAGVYDNYGYGYPAYDYAAAPPLANSYVDPGFSNAVADPQVVDTRGHIDVVVPTTNAVLWFNGYQASTVGNTRRFNTPGLQPGVDFTYNIKAAWSVGGQVMTSERNVRVRAGSQVTVDFTQPPPEPPKTLPTIIR